MAERAMATGILPGDNGRLLLNQELPHASWTSWMAYHGYPLSLPPKMHSYRWATTCPALTWLLRSHLWDLIGTTGVLSTEPCSLPQILRWS